MSLKQFSELPDYGRVWIFNAETELTDAQQATLQSSLSSFLTTWTAHRADVPAGFNILHRRFILIAVDQSATPPSGCSIDSMMHFLHELQQSVGVKIIDSPDVCYRYTEGVECVSRNRFDELARAGQVNASTIVFDNMITNVGQVRNGEWEKAAKDSWPAQAFDLRESVVHSS